MDAARLAKLMATPPGKLAQLYVDIRTKRDELRKQEKIEQARMDMLSFVLGKMLERDEQEAFRTKSGHSVYKYDLVTASLNDPIEFMEFVIEHSAWDLMEKRANKDACETYAGENEGAPPPGVTLNRFLKLGVRKGK